MTVKQNAEAAVAELTALVEALDEAQLDAAAQIIADAPRIFFTGIGRSGLSARAIAMRLMHIGRASYVVGEVATPAIGAGDVLVALTSSGRGTVLEQARAALTHGARVVTFSTGENDLTALSEVFVALPARTIVPTEQHAGSLFEQGCLVVGDALCRAVQARLGVPTSELDARHANLL